MKTYHLYQIDSFTRSKFSGNPAGVITNADGLSETDMQRIARELNNSETAFVFSSEDTAYDVHVRFFTPLKEVPICGHATIAAHYARALENNFDTIRQFQKTGAGILPVEILRENNDYKIVMTQGEILFGETLKEDALRLLMEALGICRSDRNAECPVSIVSTGHSKIMVGINHLELLHGLRPNMQLLTQVSELTGCNGFYVFTLHPDQEILVHGRMFAPAIGINEDPVTGNANGPLGAYLVHYGLLGQGLDEVTFKIRQGEAIHRAGTMEVHVDIKNQEPVSVKITGEAVIAFKTELTL